MGRVDPRVELISVKLAEVYQASCAPTFGSSSGRWVLLAASSATCSRGLVMMGYSSYEEVCQAVCEG